MDILKSSKVKVIGLLIIVFYIFSPSINGEFLNWDDTIYILNNPLMSQDISLSSFRDFYEYDQHISFVLFSFLVQINLWGTDPSVFNLINILLHAINVILVFKLSIKLLRNSNYAFLISLLFAIHPMKAETVCWIIQRKDLLFSMFYLLGVLSFIKYLKTENIIWFIVCIITGYLSVLSKLPGIILPISVLLIEFYLKNRISTKTIYLSIGLLMSILTPLDNILYVFSCIFAPLLIIDLWQKYGRRLSFIEQDFKLLFNRSYGSYMFFRILLYFVIYIVIGQFLNIFIIESYEGSFLNSSLAIIEAFLNLYIIAFVIIPCLNFYFNKKSQYKTYFKNNILFEVRISKLIIHIISTLFFYITTLLFYNLVLLNYSNIVYEGFMFLIVSIFIGLSVNYDIFNLDRSSQEKNNYSIFKIITNKYSFIFKTLSLPSLILLFSIFRNPEYNYLWYFVSITLFLSIYIRNRNNITEFIKSLIKGADFNLVFIAFGLFIVYLLYILFNLTSTSFNLNYLEISNVIFPIILFVFILYNRSFCFNYINKTLIIFLFILASATISILYTYKPYLSFFDNSIDFLLRLKYASYSLNYYLFSFISPFNLNAMIPYPDQVSDLPSIFNISPIISIILFIVIFFIIYKIKNITLKKNLIFGFLFFIANIAIVLHIVPIKGKVIVADRYMYLASFGLVFSFISIIIYIYERYFYKKNSALFFKAISLFVIIILCYQTYSRSHLWDNDRQFWGDIVEKAPDNHYAQYSLGLYYYETGNYHKALEQYNKAISIYDKNFEYFSNRGAVLIKLKEYTQAINDFERAINLNNDDYMSFNNRGILFMNIGDLYNAKIDLEIALRIKPDYQQARQNLTKVTELLSIQDSLMNQEYAHSIDLSKYYNNIGVEKAMRGELHQALEDFKIAVRYDSLNIDALTNRGNTYASLRLFDKAESDYKKTLEINPQNGGAYLNLGNILHERGSKDTACEYWYKALDLGVRDAEIMLNRFCGN